MKGTQTEIGLKELFIANSEDHLLLLFSSQKLEEINKRDESEKIREKAIVELGHARGILEKMIKYLGLEYITNWFEELNKKESDQLKEKFMLTATVYMLSKLLAEKLPERKDELETKSKEKYEDAKKLYERILDIS
ncbi:hypothetical protein SUSAZ_00260 [Sulfolobus acidocaldarius SUSAZ]|nr:hypothetical protein SUSAZ_00260 [Sulfolobus acidocaldarius SUSAZ]